MGETVTLSSLPKITVLMPVFNGGRFLREAVESILRQTFGDFEFLIVNDGSYDDTADILKEYRDPRIRVVHNEENLGLVASLNRGIDLAGGEYVARMDCDDISLPVRLARQVEYLDAKPSCAVVAVMVKMIDEDGIECGDWVDDRRTPSFAKICRFLPKANCIAHPGVMIRKSVLTGYRYNKSQCASEDYDLWLRMCADGLVIDKIAEPLLRYRINPGSVTSESNKKRPDFKNVRTKAIFLRDRIGERKLNSFVLNVFLYIFKDFFYFVAKEGLGLFNLRPETAGEKIGSFFLFRSRRGVKKR
jgi:glycosyltransferase involved in cell wall biosynthesis